jgi:HlyD family secretion protein
VKASDLSLHAVLGGPSGRPLWRRPALWIALLLLVAVAAGSWLWMGRRSEQAQPRYTTEPVTRGNLVVKVSANGTLQPTNKVEIGSELSGTVARVFVDVNDRVKKGQVLAELDTSKLRDQVARSLAALDVAQANVRTAQATVQEATDNLQRLQEVARLSGGKVPSQAELASAQASLARAQASVASARAAVADARAAASVDQTNLRKASIRSPMDGVVLSRAVEPGNAVAASLQAVTLFTLAEDLTRMKLEVNVDEADVGQVREGQKATFTVSSYPSRDYPATITRVAYGSTTKDNVVTYVSDLQVDNQDLSLRPGMSASATILAMERNGVLLVPNAALRFTPEVVSQAPADNGSTGVVARLMPRLPRSQGQRRAGTVTAAARQVWVLENGSPVAVAVVPGASDGRMTEVSSTLLKPGMSVITEQSARSAK